MRAEVPVSVLEDKALCREIKRRFPETNPVSHYDGRIALGFFRISRMRASANLRNWLGFLTLRMAPEAQWEIRQFANAVGEEIAAAFPRTWNLFVGGR